MTRAVSPVPVDARILEMAAEDVRRHGADRLTIVSIARAAGMSHANVYRYFPSKEALIEAISDQWLKPVESGLREIADAPDPAYDKLERMLAAVHRAYRGKRENDPNLFHLFREADARDSAVARRHRERIHSELRRVIDDGMADGAFAPGDLNRALALVLDAAHRFIHPASVALDPPGGRSRVDARFERISRLIQRALASGLR